MFRRKTGATGAFAVGALLALLLGGCATSPTTTPAKPAAAPPVTPAAEDAAPPAGPPGGGAKAASDKAAPAERSAPVRGLYVSGWSAGQDDRWKQLVTLVDKTELNAMVIDVKEDGMISYDTDIPLARQVGASRDFVPGIDEKLAQLKARGIFPIARITCFRDKIVPRKRPDLAIQRPGGGPWRDRAGHTWLDPYNKTNWDYNVDLAIDAARRGFGEIQWDYVRFPSEGRSRPMRMPAKARGDARSEARVIADFLRYAREKLRPHGVAVSADVFGLTTSAAPDYDMGIGQKLALMTPHLDYICPMVYPSHYARGEYGIPHPNASPYRTVARALKDGNKRVKGSTCKIRPWLQDFSLGGVRYGPKQVRPDPGGPGQRHPGVPAVERQQPLLIRRPVPAQAEKQKKRAQGRGACKRGRPPSAVTHRPVHHVCCFVRVPGPTSLFLVDRPAKSCGSSMICKSRAAD